MDNHSGVFDCIVVGSGHAGSCAALSAHEAGCKNGKFDLYKCPPEWVGGNGYFTAGAHRTVHEGLRDLLPIVRNVSPEDLDRIDMVPYSREDFIQDIMRLSDSQSDSGLVNALVDNSRSVIQWLSDAVDVPFIFSFNRQAYEVDGKQKFWGGMVLSVEEGGKGLIRAHQIALKKAGILIRYNTRAIEILNENGVIKGLLVQTEGGNVVLKSPAVILASGGFEANASMRSEYLGREWEKAKVRGTRYNTGDGLALAKNVGARFIGDWKGCHSTAWDADAPDNCGVRDITNQFTKSGYPLGIMVNKVGKRFVDEGEDFRNYTYAKFGKAILNQPEGFAFQIWDSQTIGALRKEEYGEGIVDKILADSIKELSEKLGENGLSDKTGFVETLDAFNNAVAKNQKLAWNPAIKDNLSTGKVLELPRSNWALPIVEPPFMAVKVMCGITFTFGGLAIDPETAAVVSEDGKIIKGLFATGEIVGGLFYNNYPGGSGLTAGAVWGRKAGYAAAELNKSIL